MYKFELKPHSDPLGDRKDVMVVEVLDRHKSLAATIYPTEKGIKIVSRHIETIERSDVLDIYQFNFNFVDYGDPDLRIVP